MNGSLDTNVVLRYILQDVPEQFRAARQLFSSATGPFLLTDTALTEIAFVMEREYGIDRVQIAALLDRVMRLSVIVCNRSFFVDALELFVAHPALSMEDCCLAVQAKDGDAVPLYTFDKKLTRHVPYAKLLV